MSQPLLPFVDAPEHVAPSDEDLSRVRPGALLKVRLGSEFLWLEYMFRSLADESLIGAPVDKCLIPMGCAVRFEPRHIHGISSNRMRDRRPKLTVVPAEGDDE